MRAIFIFYFLFLMFGLLTAPVLAGFTCPRTGASHGDEADCFVACGMACTSTGGSGNGASFQNPLKSASFEALVQSLANWVAAIALPIAAMFIIYSGFLFVTAGGNQSKLDAAKTTFYWTIIGAAIVVGAWALATAIVNFAKGL